MSIERHTVLGANCISSQGESINFFFSSEESAANFLKKQSEGGEKVSMVGGFFPRQIDSANKERLDKNGFLEGFFPGHVESEKEKTTPASLEKDVCSPGYSASFLNFTDDEGKAGYLLSRERGFLDELKKDDSFGKRFGVTFEGQPGTTCVDPENKGLLQRFSFVEGLYQEHLVDISK